MRGHIAQKNAQTKKQPETTDYTRVNQVWLRPVAEKTAGDYIDYTSVNQVWLRPESKKQPETV